MSGGDARAGEVAAELAYPRSITPAHDERAANLLQCADSADRAAGIYRVSLDAAIEAAAEQDCEDWENCTVREVHRGWARKALTAAVMGGAQ